MKVKTKKAKRTYTLTLSIKEAKLLAALADFPMHSSQPDTVRTFLEDLMGALDEKLGFDRPGLREAGFVDKTVLSAGYSF